MNTETKNEKSVVLDQDGHLANREDWNKELAQDLAPRKYWRTHGPPLGCD